MMQDFGSSETEWSGPETRGTSAVFLTTLVLALCLALLGGCGQSDSPSPDRLSPSIADRLDAESPSLRLDLVELAVESDEQVATCMLEQGFDYLPFDYSYRSDLYEAQLQAFQDPESFAASYGYGIVDVNELESLQASVGSSSPEAENVDYQVALYGASLEELASGEVELGGCLGSDSDTLFKYRSYIEQVNEAVAQATETAAVEEARRTWARCMAEHGHNYWSPSDAVEEISRQFRAMRDASSATNPLSQEQYDEIHRLELQVANADYVLCDGAHIRAVIADETATGVLPPSNGRGVIERLDEARDG